MSQENVEIVRRGYERFNETGEPDYDTLDPEIVYDVSRRTFDPGVYRGREGVRQFLAAQREQWRTMRLEPQDFVDAGDQVIVSVRIVAVGRESGVETTAERADLWTLLLVQCERLVAARWMPAFTRKQESLGRDFGVSVAF